MLDPRLESEGVGAGVRAPRTTVRGLHNVVIPALVILAVTAPLRLCAQDAAPSSSTTQVPSNLALLERIADQALDEALRKLELTPGQPWTILSSAPHEANGFVKRLLAQKLASDGFEVKVVQSAAESDSALAASTASASSNANAANTAASARARAEAARAAAAAATAAGADSTGQPADSMTVAPAPEAPPPAAPQDKPRIDARTLTAYETLPKNVLPAGPVLDVEVLELGVNYAEAGRTMMVGAVEFTRVAGAYVRLHVLRGPEGTLEKMSTGERRYWDRLSSRERALAEGASYPFSPPQLDAPGLGRFVEPAIVVGIVGSLIYLFYTNQN